MTPNDLRTAEARYQRAFGPSEEARAYRNNNMIVTAVRKGMPAIEVAKATGLTRARISQIAPRSEREER